jgi:hypothetical protein
VSVPIIAVLVGAIAVLIGGLAHRHQRTERPYAKALRELARQDGTPPLLPAVTATDFRHGARAERLHRVRVASTTVLGLLGLALVLAPAHRLASAALGAALILRVLYELLVQARVTSRAR